MTQEQSPIYYMRDAMQPASQEVAIDTAEHQRPSVLYRPRLIRYVDRWCALYGDNLQDGVSGFGDSPEAAMAAFDAEWGSPLKDKAAAQGQKWLDLDDCPDGRVFFALSCGHVADGRRHGLIQSWDDEFVCCVNSVALKAMPVILPAHPDKEPTP